MAKGVRNPGVDFYFLQSQKWKVEVERLRSVILDCGLTEQLKWGVPCYTHEDTNIILIHDFKDYCAVLFFKGALLQDPKGILIQQTKNVQSARQVRFTNLKELMKLEKTLKSYIREAIKIAKSGQQVPLKKTAEYSVPEEFQTKLEESPALKKAFKALTPGRQRGYLLHFSSAKQSKTREARVEKYTRKILEGKGLDD